MIPDTILPEAKKQTITSSKSSTTLHIRNIPFDATSKQLEDFFNHFGPIQSCFVIPTNDSIVNKGFGFIQFAIHQDALRASKNTALFQNRLLTIEFAKRKSNTEKPVTKQHSVVCSKPCLIIRNLPFKCTQQDLQDAVGAFGNVVSIRLAYKSVNGINQFRGFAFVEFDTMQAAQKLQSAKIKVLNRIVSIDFSLPKDKYDSLVPKADEKADEKAEEEEVVEEEEEQVIEESIEEKEEQEAIEEKQEEKKQEEKKPALKGDPECTLFIRNLSFDSTEQDLKEKYLKLTQIPDIRSNKICANNPRPNKQIPRNRIHMLQGKTRRTNLH